MVSKCNINGIKREKWEEREREREECGRLKGSGKNIRKKKFKWK